MGYEAKPEHSSTTPFRHSGKRTEGGDAIDATAQQLRVYGSRKSAGNEGLKIRKFGEEEINYSDQFSPSSNVSSQ